MQRGHAGFDGSRDSRGNPQRNGRGDPAARFLAFIERIEAWLDDANSWKILISGVDGLPLLDTLDLIVKREGRRLGEDGPDGDNVRAVLRIERAQHWVAALATDEARSTGVSSPDEQNDDRARVGAAALAAALDEAVSHSVAGMVTVVWRDRLADLLSAHRQLLEEAPVSGRARTNILDAIGYGAFALGRSHETLGDPRLAIVAYEEAADAYRLSANDKKTDVALRAAQRVRFVLDADLGGAPTADLQLLFGSELDPVARAHAAIRLARQSADANDLVGAWKRAEIALAALDEAGFPDPASKSIPEIGATWVVRLLRDQSAHFMTEFQEISEIAMQGLVHRWSAQQADRPHDAQVTLENFQGFSQLVQEKYRQWPSTRQQSNGGDYTTISRNCG